MSKADLTKEKKGSKKDIDKSTGSVKSKKKQEAQPEQHEVSIHKEVPHEQEHYETTEQIPQHQMQTFSQPRMMEPSYMRPPEPPRGCLHHGQMFTYFCETCEEPICPQCTVVGPHNNQLHRINRMQDAYKMRTLKIQEQIKVNLLTKREQLLAQIHRIEYRIEEIKYVKTIIERDARAEYSAILERLRSSEGGKLALLHHEIAELQKYHLLQRLRDLDQINDVGSTFYELTSAEDITNFLLRSRQIYENIEYLVAKPFKVQVDIYPYDLPRELTELRLQLQRAVAQKQLLDFKNEVIWKLMTEKRRDEEQLKNELERQAADEIAEWSRLVDKFSHELKKYQQVCYFCGCAMEKENVNKKCVVNHPEAEIDKVYSSEAPPADLVGSERHFFGKPFGE